MKLAGQHQAVARPVPAHERLDLGHRAVAQLHDRLVVQLELAALDGGAQRLLERELLDGPLVEVLLEDHALVAALVLGPVHGHVGVADERLGRHRRVRRVGDADAGGDEELAAVGEHERLAQLRRRTASAAAAASPRRRSPVAHDHELVAAEAARACRPGASGSLEPLGHLLQHEVADGVALGVVDDLEAVEVDEQHGDAAEPRPAIDHERLVDAAASAAPGSGRSVSGS